MDIGDVRVPAPVLELAGDRPIRPVWVNVLGGVTYEIGSDPDRAFVKWLPSAEAHRLSAEAVRLEWLAGRAEVPRVLSQGHDGQGAWLVTAALAGTSAVSPEWRARPEVAVRSLGEGLRALHEALPVADCRFSWSVDDRLEIVRARIASGAVEAAALAPEFVHLTFAEVLRLLEDPPAADRLVVCHGDACAPNTLLDSAGSWCGHVDFSALGVADRWADLAVAIWSTSWNYGPGWEGTLLEAYGVEPDPRRSDYYQLLWQLGP